MNFSILAVLAICLMSGCDFNILKFGFTDYDVNSRFADSMALNETYPKAPITVDGSSYLLAFASDLHFKDSAEFYLPLFEQFDERHPAAVIYNGDLYNGQAEYADVAFETLETYTKPDHYYICGNHDQYFGWENFRDRFGSSTYIVPIIGPDYRDLLIALESGSSTLGQDQYDWLVEQLKHRDEYRYCFIATHSNLVIHGFNFGTYGEDELHQLYALFRDNHVTAVISGHSHIADEREILGVDYCNTAATKNGHYGLLWVGEEVVFEARDFIGSINNLAEK